MTHILAGLLSPQRISNIGSIASTLLAALLLALLGAVVAPASALAVGSISGTVTASGGAPVADVEVCAWSLEEEDEEEEKCAETGSGGGYAIAGLLSGDYKVVFWPAFGLNFIRQFYDGKSSWAEADVVGVEDGVDRSGVDAVLEEGGWIEGRVVDTISKLAIEDVLVCAFPIDESGSAGCAETVADGTYSIVGLATDSYEVGFYPEPGSGYLEQHYDGKSSWFEATPVPVTAGAGIDSIDAELLKGGTISGTVTDALSAAGIGSSSVCLLEPSEGEIIDCHLTGPNGHYAITGLPVGSYKVWFSPDVPGWEGADDYFQQFYDAKPIFAQASSIAVGAGTVVSGIGARLVSRKASVVPPPPAPVALPPAVTSPLSLKPKPKPKKCRKGQRKVRRKGKIRCAPKAKPQRRRASKH